MFSAPFLITLLDRVKAVVRRVARPGAERARQMAARTPPYVPAEGPVSPLLGGLAQGWMAAKLRAVSALMRRIEAGETIASPATAARAAVVAGQSVPVTRGTVPPEARLPRGFGWMCGLSSDVRRDGAAFVELLNEPWMKAKVLAAPERMAGLIGPILTATGQARPEWFPVAPVRVRAGRAAATCSRPAREEGSGSGVEAAEVRDAVDSEFQSRGGTPPPAAPTRGGGTVFVSKHVNFRSILPEFCVVFERPAGPRSPSMFGDGCIRLYSVLRRNGTGRTCVQFVTIS
jgi:hypothetical protein